MEIEKKKKNNACGDVPVQCVVFGLGESKSCVRVISPDYAKKCNPTCEAPA